MAPPPTYVQISLKYSRTYQERTQEQISRDARTGEIPRLFNARMNASRKARSATERHWPWDRGRPRLHPPERKRRRKLSASAAQTPRNRYRPSATHPSKRTRMTRVPIYRSNGRYYGYPRCCIAEFIEGIERRDAAPTDAEYRKANRAGQTLGR